MTSLRKQGATYAEDRRHHELLVPARRLASARLCASGREYGLPAIGIADHNTLAGVVRAFSD